jgi:hypothetical protein
MILEAFFGFVFEIVGELVGESLVALFCAGLARIVPLRLRYGTAWRWRARQVIADRRIARGLYLRNG